MAQAKTKNTRNASERGIPPRLVRLGREVLVLALVGLTGYLLICLVLIPQLIRVGRPRATEVRLGISGDGLVRGLPTFFYMRLGIQPTSFL